MTAEVLVVLAGGDRHLDALLRIPDPGAPLQAIISRFLGADTPPHRVSIDGRSVAATTPIAAAGLRHGSEIVIQPDDRPRTSPHHFPLPWPPPPPPLPPPVTVPRRRRGPAGSSPAPLQRPSLPADPPPPLRTGPTNPPTAGHGGRHDPDPGSVDPGIGS